MHNKTTTLERLGGTNTLSLFYLREHGTDTSSVWVLPQLLV
jgi:hypothetical protein